MAAITVEALPARYGDCLWIECERDGQRPWRLLLDGGPPEAWPDVSARLRALGADEAELDLLVVSHVDSDHIGGILPLLAGADLRVLPRDVWFNGLPQLPDEQGLTRSVAEGESLVDLLTGAGVSPPLPWNDAFGGAAAMTAGDGGFATVSVPGGPTLTLLSPTPRRLTALRETWTEALDRLQRGEPEEPPAPEEPVAPLDDLEQLARTPTSNDRAVPNGSSIAFLLEHRGASCLLTADAVVPVMGAALTSLANARGGQPIELDLLKVSHHGSRGNTSAKLLALTPARHYLVSTNGEQFGHPHDVTLARIVTGTAPSPTLWFNYETAATARWADPALQERYGFATRYPDGAAGGIRVELAGDPGV